MNFSDVPDGSALFVNANTFVYHFISDPRNGTASTQLLDRVERQAIAGWTSPHVLAEMAHRLMTIEACMRFGWPHQGIAARLRRHWQQCQHLSVFRDAHI